MVALLRSSFLVILSAVFMAACGGGSDPGRFGGPQAVDPGAARGDISVAANVGSIGGSHRGSTGGSHNGATSRSHGDTDGASHSDAFAGAAAERSRTTLTRLGHGENSQGADTSEFREQRHAMVAEQIAARGVDDEQVLEAMRRVPRHRFVPADQVPLAYANRPLPIGYGQTISQPYIVAYMTLLAEPEPSDRVLEIGTGSGYQAAVLAEIVDRVYTIEIVPELARTAKQRLEQLGYDNIEVRQGDGYFGWEEEAPFDAVVVTAASEHIPPMLIEQLADQGRMVIPVGSPYRTQTLMLIEKRGDELSTRSVAPVRFVPFTRGE